MKQVAGKKIPNVLCMVITAAALACCSFGSSSRTANAESGTAAETAAETVAEIVTEAAAETNAEAAESSGGAAANSAYGGGSPWIDSDLKEALAGTTEPSLKDDFHLKLLQEIANPSISVTS